MREITQQQIASLSPGASALGNARKISQSGGFVKRFRSEDDTFYMGECKGSGKSNYTTSADFAAGASAPVFRCSCPSRQFPCKHSLALLFEIMEGRGFEVIEIPPDILDKRAKKEARAQKSGTDSAKSAKPKTTKAARAKKIRKQLEGLDLAAKMVSDLMSAGLGTLAGNSVRTYRDLCKQLGDYYLPGPQILMKRLILEIEGLHKDGDARHHEAAVRILIRLHALESRARAYLTSKLESGDMEDDDNILYEALGGVWQTDRLRQLGLTLENARLMQLSFEVYYDGAREEYVDLGYWANVDTGEISATYNFRPLKALKYVRRDDSVFSLAEIPLLTYYPGDLNRRVRWEDARYSPVTQETLAQLLQNAQPTVAAAVKLVKNQIKNTLSDDTAALLVAFRRIGRTADGSLVLEDAQGGSILLDDIPGREATTYRLALLPQSDLMENQALFGAFFYDPGRRRICLQPYSVVSDSRVIRLLY